MHIRILRYKQKWKYFEYSALANDVKQHRHLIKSNARQNNEFLRLMKISNQKSAHKKQVEVPGKHHSHE